MTDLITYRCRIGYRDATIEGTVFVQAPSTATKAEIRRAAIEVALEEGLPDWKESWLREDGRWHPVAVAKVEKFLVVRMDESE